MTTASGWYFAGLAAEAPSDPGTRPGAAAVGLCLTAAGGAAMVAGDALIRQSLMLLLATVPGERVMRPDYGCPLDRLMFAPNDATTAGLAVRRHRPI